MGRYPQPPRVAALVLLALLGGQSASSASGPATAREDDLREAREAKAAQLEPKTTGKIERFLGWVRDGHVAERLATPGEGFRGFRPFAGSLGGNSGFSLGIAYDRPGRHGSPLAAHASASASLRAYYRGALSGGLEQLLGGRLALLAEGEVRHMPSEIFFGERADSRREDRASYLLDDVSLGFHARLRLSRHLIVGARGAWVDVDLGRGGDGRDVLDAFPPSAIPGLLSPPEFLRKDVYAVLEARDVPGNPRKGFYAAVTFDDWDDRDAARDEFRRLSADLRQYLPLFNRHHAFGLRERVVLDDVDTGRLVPFYLQETLGGPHDLRGYDRFRFRDRNQLLLSAEYVWDAGALVDGAIFVDAGKVARLRHDLDLEGLEKDFGVSLRLKGTSGVALRTDIAHGDEGTKFYISAGGLF